MSVVCPVCGRSHGQIMLSRVVRWSVILALVLWLLFEFALKGRMAISG